MAESGSGSLVGQKLGAYRVESLLGEGAMGEVYRSVHEALGRPVAIKTLKPAIAGDPSLLERFFAEARAVNIIRHENIVECTDMVNVPGGQSYIVMEMLEGKTLAGAIREAGRMPARRAGRIAAQIADAIGAAHEKGIVHRDLKPDNVFLIRRAGTSDYVKVLDFGIARLRPDYGVTATQSGALIGTPAYMSPEQAKGERAGPPSDIYALGVIVYQMMSGRLPFAVGSLPAMLMAHVAEIPPRLDTVVSDCPPALVEVVARALAKEPDARQANMTELRIQLLEAVGLPVDLTASVLASPSGMQGAMPTPFPGTIGAAARGSGSAQKSASPAAFEKTSAPGAAAVPGVIGASSLSLASGEARPLVGVNATVPAPPKKNRVLLMAAAAVLVAGGAIVAVVTTGAKKDKGASPQPAASPGPSPTSPMPTPAPAPAATPDAGVVVVQAAKPDAGAPPVVAVEDPKKKPDKRTVKKPGDKKPPVVEEKPPIVEPPVVEVKEPEKKKDLTKDLVDDPPAPPKPK